jgi:uncharacterized protein (DUF1501 family)
MNSLQTYTTGNGDEQHTLVVIFLRGGADGLNMVAPLGDDGYFRARPRIAIDAKTALRLDDFFGLNPLLKELLPAYQEGSLAIVHAAGSEDDTRSHFEAQDLMEHGGLAGGGWLGRFLRANNSGSNGPLSAVALGHALPECLRGAPAVTVLETLADFSLGTKRAALVNQLAKLYGLQNTEVGAAGRSTIEAVRRIADMRNTVYRPANGAVYGNDDFAKSLLELARLIKARVGLQAASLDLGGWDSHFGQSAVMNPLMVRLAKGLAAFHKDLAADMQRVTLVAMTEFGRRVAENSAFGTDHGRGSVMFLMGGSVRGGKVYGRWPGLSKDVLDGPGDLPVTTNYRNVLAPILERHGGQPALPQTFPNFELNPVPIFG